MTRIPPVTREHASERSQQLLNVVQKKLGTTPNMMTTMAHSPATLDAYLKFSDALGHGDLPAKTRESIALTVSQANSCQYCLSAHTAIGKMVGLTADDIRLARSAHAEEPKTDAILKLSSRIVETRGLLDDADIATAREAGVTDSELTEIVGNVALNLLTNYFNHVSEAEVDFPPAEELDSAASCPNSCPV